jgi:uncharacterized protein YkwD
MITAAARTGTAGARARRARLALRLVVALLSVAAAARAEDRLVAEILEERGEFSCLTPEESALLNSLNEYRADHRLPRVPLSRSLTKVARLHAVDLVENRPERRTDSRGRACNLHSWSDTGFWSPVCYTGDQRNLRRMLDKPREITRRAYGDIAYENVYWTSAAEVYSPRVLDTWRKSPSHNALILEIGGWQGSDWSALGVGIYRNVAVMWLGSAADPLGQLKACEPAEGREALP